MALLSTRNVSTAAAAVVSILAVTLLAIAAKPAQQTSAFTKQRYLSPIEMALSPDGRLLFVVCQESDEVRVVDTQSNKVVDTIPVGHVPRGIAQSKDGARLYVTNAWSDSVSVIDTNTRKVEQTLATGFERRPSILMSHPAPTGRIGELCRFPDQQADPAKALNPKPIHSDPSDVLTPSASHFPLALKTL